MIKWTKHTAGECRKYSDVPFGARIEEVNGKPSLGNCEICGKPVLDGQKYTYSEDGIICHYSCWRKTEKTK
jgi:hypothetical protein